MSDTLPDRLADTRWKEEEAVLLRRPPSPRPTLVVMVGVPLSGKSRLARALVGAAATRTLLVENDALRERVAAWLDEPEPTYSGGESFLTYRTAWNLLERALRSGANAVHDGTNLNEGQRKGAYASAEAAGAPAYVVFVRTDPEIVRARAEASAPARREAYRKLGGRRPSREACTRACVVVDGAREVRENVERLSGEPELKALFAQET